jgi:hypothetical protein
MRGWHLQEYQEEVLYITYVISRYMTEQYHAPDVPSESITPTFVRDQLLLCFESANREFAALNHQSMTDEALKGQVKTFVETVFSQCGVSYVSPTKLGIVTAISECKRNAEKMMGSSGTSIIDHHYSEMMKLVDRLGD